MTVLFYFILLVHFTLFECTHLGGSLCRPFYCSFVWTSTLEHVRWTCFECPLLVYQYQGGIQPHKELYVYMFPTQNNTFHAIYWGCVKTLDSHFGVHYGLDKVWCTSLPSYPLAVLHYFVLSLLVGLLSITYQNYECHPDLFQEFWVVESSWHFRDQYNISP